uniref:AlNc14C138G7173 protein n=1 Tax=Albugo laibachii Nc14 TaxID=890382 RepID=F0WKY3_9STRA|nr:AlNc14C138G7173 [Albugo laibachii Nc14]|eukprot:CCA21942.1 AlNc14C138G7173 [Albugo laibachii Nc14]
MQLSRRAFQVKCNDSEALGRVISLSDVVPKVYFLVIDKKMSVHVFNHVATYLSFWARVCVCGHVEDESCDIRYRLNEKGRDDPLVWIELDNADVVAIGFGPEGERILSYSLKSRHQLRIHPILSLEV